MNVVKHPGKVVTAVTLLVLLYSISPYIAIPDDVIIGMFLVIPFLTVWMAYVILRYDKKPVKELTNDEEWGYQDKPREKLGMF